MKDTTKSRLLLARRKFAAGEVNKLEYCEEINYHHAHLFDYPAFLSNTDVAGIQITAEGVTVSSRSHGISMFVDAVDLHATPYALLGFGDYESDETVFLKSVFCDGDVLLDVGANLGWYSLVLGRHRPWAKVFAFEPIPSTVSVLKRNIELNKLDNVEPICLGVSDREGELSFLYAPDVSGATSLKVLGQKRGKSVIQSVVCKVTRLDSFCANRNLVPAILKIDVEGAELMVLQGAGDVLQHAPIILVELLRKWSQAFNYHPNDVFHYLEKFGYRAWVFAEDGSGLLQPCESVDEETAQTNFLFMHPLRHSSIISKWQRV